VSDIVEDEHLLQLYAETISSADLNISKVCAVGRALGRAGLRQEHLRCFDLAVTAMNALVRSGYVDTALQVETVIYECFVKQTESEQHYFESFQRWTNFFATSAEQLILPPLEDADPQKVCFFLHSGFFLGHTSVLLQTLRDWQQDPYFRSDVYVAILTKSDENFISELKLCGAHVLTPGLTKQTKHQMLAADLLDIRMQLQTQGIGTVVWVSVPTLASYALNLPMAPRQVFWSLKLHPLHFSKVKTHICGGHIDEKIRIYNRKEWAVCAFPLTGSYGENNLQSVATIKANYSKYKVLLGSLAREEKFNSPEFLDCLVSILKKHPAAKFIYSGRQNAGVLVRAAEAAGVLKQVEFIGWVDTNLYAEVIDIFLETFPFGCGITALQAMSHTTPVLSYNAEDTIFGYQLKGGIPAAEYMGMSNNDFENLPVMTGRDSKHYIHLATRLIDDLHFRRQIGERQRAHFEKQRADSFECSRRLRTLIVGD
jgi:hypothetical protein